MWTWLEAIKSLSTKWKHLPKFHYPRIPLSLQQRKVDMIYLVLLVGNHGRIPLGPASSELSQIRNRLTGRHTTQRSTATRKLLGAGKAW